MSRLRTLSGAGEQMFVAVLLVVGGVLAIVLAPFAIIRLVSWWNAAGRPESASIAIVAVAAAVAAVAILSLFLAFEERGLQTFARAGLAKQLVLPMVYVVFALVWYRLARSHPGFRYPVWWWLLWAVLVLAALLEAVLVRQALSLGAFLQGVALVTGFLIVSAVGMHSPDWGSREIKLFVGALGALALLSQFTGIATTPFSALQVPAAFMFLFIGIRVPRWRAPALLLGLVLLAPIVIRAAQDPNSSVAVYAQLVACAILVLVVLIPRGLRGAALIVAAAAAVVMVAGSGSVGLFLGVAAPGSDITLAHRAYEAAAVFDLLKDPAWIVTGGGPGATVDLSQSPDAVTLSSSGRDVFAVDDVHLLTSWFLLKFGVLGLVWLTVFVVALGRVAVPVLRSADGFDFGFVLLLFTVAGIAAAVPAATYLFTNPLVAFCLGVLVARGRVSRSRVSVPRIARAFDLEKTGGEA